MKFTVLSICNDAKLKLSLSELLVLVKSPANPKISDSTDCIFLNLLSVALATLKNVDVLVSPSIIGTESLSGLQKFKNSVSNLSKVSLSKIENNSSIVEYCTSDSILNAS